MQRFRYPRRPEFPEIVSGIIFSQNNPCFFDLTFFRFMFLFVFLFDGLLRSSLLGVLDQLPA